MPTSLQPTASANTPQQKEARRRGTGFCIARKCSSSRPASTRFWRFLHGWVLTCRLQCRSASAGLRALLSQRWVSDGESFESLPLWPQQRTGIRLDVSWLVDGSTTRRVARTALGFLGCIPWWSLSGFSGWWCCGGREVGFWKTEKPLVQSEANQSTRIRSFSTILGVWSLQETTSSDPGLCRQTRRIKQPESRQFALLLHATLLVTSGGICLKTQDAA
jgi:hypothetical protein